MRTACRLAACAFAAALIAPTWAAAQQSRPALGRVSVHFASSSLTDTRQPGATDHRQVNEITTSFSWRSAQGDGAGEFALDGRAATYPGSTRDARTSLYDGYVGYRLAGGAIGVRAGQMWLTELGGLGSVAGALVEGRRRQPTSIGTIRAGVFGGIEPSVLDIGYEPSIRKAGGYVAIEGSRARRHVIGFVSVRNSGLTERSVITATNYIPAGRHVFIYQASDYDLRGPAGQGSGRLSYFLTNVRATAGSRIDLQGSYHRGRSVDTRSLTLDVLHGRPVSTASVEGLMYESIGGRAWIGVAPHVRVSAGYARDRNNREDASTIRYNLGASATNIGRRGIDLTVDRASISGPTRTYVAWDVSAGATIGTRLYVTGDVSTALSSVKLVSSAADMLFETRPRTRRYSVSGLSHINRRYSLLLNLDVTLETGFRDVRELVGLMVRF